MIALMRLAIFVLLAAVAGCGSNTSLWHYVVPEPGDLMEHPPLRALPLSDRKPPELKEPAHYRGSQRRYGEFRFGSVGSTLVTVVLDRTPDGETDLYVDSNRNRSIEDSERIAGAGRKYHVPLSVEVLKGDKTESLSRTVAFRLGRGGQSLSYATAGFVEGVLALEGRDVPVRRVDANGDGGMADPVDLLWLNRSGKWNPFTDRFPVTPIIQLDDSRYAVRSDWVGQRLSLEKSEGAGELELALPDSGKQAFMSLDLVLMGRDGSIAKLDLAQPRLQVPAGQYAVYELSTMMKDPSGGEPWVFSFSQSVDWSGDGSKHWYDVESGGRAAIRPLDALTLSAKLGNSDRQYHAGDAVTVQPRLMTGDGLSLRACYRSDKADSSKRHSGAEISLVGGDGDTLDSAQSGFS